MTISPTRHHSITVALARWLCRLVPAGLLLGSGTSFTAPFEPKGSVRGRVSQAA